jgi:hypothetical protein
MRRAVIVLSIALAGPALAHDPAAKFARDAAAQTTQAPAHNPLDCWCLAKGRRFAPGESVCLKTAEGGRMAECRMEINVMSWGLTDEPCPET